MILFSELLLFCRGFPPPRGPGGCLVSRKPRLCPRLLWRNRRVAWSGKPEWLASAVGAGSCGPGVALSQCLAVRGPIGPFALFQLIGWPGRRILPGEARESPRNAQTSRSVQPSARAQLSTRTSVYRCTPPILRTLHPTRKSHGERVWCTPTTQTHSRTPREAPTLRATLMGEKPNLLGKSRRGSFSSESAWQGLTAG